MSRLVELQTARLHLRQWRDDDRAPFAALNADPDVMKYFPSVQSREASDASIEWTKAHHQRHGWGNWACEFKDTGEFIGFVGLSIPKRIFPFSPCVEVGWRLAQPFWGRGLATEAARESLRFGFEQLGLHEIVSMTALSNLRSRAVMERIGLSNSGEDFDHEALPQGHALRRHCLYRLSSSAWREGRRAAVFPIPNSAARG